MLDDCHFLLNSCCLCRKRTLNSDSTWSRQWWWWWYAQILKWFRKTSELLRESVKKHEKNFGKFVNSSAYFIFYSKSAEQLNKADGGAGVDKAMNVNSLWANKLAAEHTHTHTQNVRTPTSKKERFPSTIIILQCTKNGKDCWIWQPKNGSVSMINESMCILISPLWLIRISDGFSSVPSCLWSKKPPKKA